MFHVHIFEFKIRISNFLYNRILRQTTNFMMFSVRLCCLRRQRYVGSNRVWRLPTRSSRLTSDAGRPTGNWSLVTARSCNFRTIIVHFYFLEKACAPLLTPSFLPGLTPSCPRPFSSKLRTIVFTSFFSPGVKWNLSKMSHKLPQ